MENIEVINTKIKGVYILKNNIFKDNRGVFIKTFNFDEFKKFNLCRDFKESYYSISKKDTLRGMHFQMPPFDHEKLIYVTNGRILDVVVDLRKNSKTYKKFVSIDVSAKNGISVYIPRGCAHGFLSLEDNSIVIYNVSTVYNKESDAGIRYDSFGMDWGVENPVISERDLSFTGILDIENIFEGEAYE